MKGFIFDVDGTMVDNMMVHHKAWQEQLANLGLNMSIEKVKQTVHGVNSEILNRLFGKKFNKQQQLQIANEKEATYRRIFSSQLKLIKGLPSFLDKAYLHNIPMAIASAGPPENVNYVINNLNIAHYFKGVFHSASVEKGKPNPEVFLKAAASMGVSSKECLVFEDSITGAKAAKNAGSQAIIITTTHSKTEFIHFNHILQFINDFTELNFDKLIN